ncbi:MAG: HD-GYP domain-containing protein [Syntrophales bacterium]|nr:HD-GYP domain-containing protein [Syntrophales bacterium]
MSFKVPVDELRVGMFVEIPLPWHRHPFIKNAFLISSLEDLRKIKKLGIHEVIVDPERSRVLEAEEGALQDEEIVEERTPGVLPELPQVIRDPSLKPEKKADLMYTYTLQMMDSLFKTPTVSRIREIKSGIIRVVDIILKDGETTRYLINMTSHDWYTYTHCTNVGILGVALAKAVFGLDSEHDLYALGVGFFLHDLGKVRIADSILNKNGPLTEGEMKEIRKHPYYGFAMLTEARQLTEESKIIVLQHHERYDGSGYPRGLKGNEIHLYGRLCALVDVFDALTSDRPYRKGMSSFEALKLMRDEMLHHFQASLFEKMVNMLKV